MYSTILDKLDHFERKKTLKNMNNKLGAVGCELVLTVLLSNRTWHHLYSTLRRGMKTTTRRRPTTQRTTTRPLSAIRKGSGENELSRTVFDRRSDWKFEL